MDRSQDNPAPDDRSGTRLDGLLHHPELWRAGQLQRAPDTLTSGYAALDEQLPGGGWPRSALAEFLIATAGIGELRLLVPLIGALSRSEARWVAWINPPFVPYAPALAALGVDVGKILLIHPRNHQQALWALERASRGGTCSLALAWLDERELELKDTRRLQLAARQGRTLTCLFRPESAVAVKSMAELRLQVMPDIADHPAVTPVRQNTVLVDIHKRRGGWPVRGIRVPIDHEPDPVEIREQLDLWRNRYQQREAPAGDTVHRPNRPRLDAPGDPNVHRVH